MALRHPEGCQVDAGTDGAARAPRDVAVSPSARAGRARVDARYRSDRADAWRSRTSDPTRAERAPPAVTACHDGPEAGASHDVCGARRRHLQRTAPRKEVHLRAAGRTRTSYATDDPRR